MFKQGPLLWILSSSKRYISFVHYSALSYSFLFLPLFSFTEWGSFCWLFSFRIHLSMQSFIDIPKSIKKVQCSDRSNSKLLITSNVMLCLLSLIYSSSHSMLQVNAGKVSATVCHYHFSLKILILRYFEVRNVHELCILLDAEQICVRSASWCCFWVSLIWIRRGRACWYQPGLDLTLLHGCL